MARASRGVDSGRAVRRSRSRSWRLSLYAALALAWWQKVRPRAVVRLRRDREDGQQALTKLRRLELMALGILVLLEATNLINQLGGA